MGEDEAGTAEAVQQHREAAHPITLGYVDPSRPECRKDRPLAEELANG
jgi:hypothetical protein